MDVKFLKNQRTMSVTGNFVVISMLRSIELICPLYMSVHYLSLMNFVSQTL